MEVKMEGKSGVTETTENGLMLAVLVSVKVKVVEPVCPATTLTKLGDELIHVSACALTAIPNPNTATNICLLIFIFFISLCFIFYVVFMFLIPNDGTTFFNCIIPSPPNYSCLAATIYSLISFLLQVKKLIIIICVPALHQPFPILIQHQ